ncbi:hypothetical protein, partial [Pseudomonas aeruginosa]|uniref:hypothetical protein n=1 Tax=Pseudomonas aeruginosa TaxID=287 RepID=UPI003CC55B5B
LVGAVLRPEGASLARGSDRFFAAFLLRYRASLGLGVELSRLMVVLLVGCVLGVVGFGWVVVLVVGVGVCVGFGVGGVVWGVVLGLVRVV